MSTAFPPGSGISYVPDGNGRITWQIHVPPGTPDDAAIALAHEAIRQREVLAAALANDPATDKQLWLLKKLAGEQQIDLEAWAQQRYQRAVDDLRKGQASDLISELKGDPPPGEPLPPPDDPSTADTAFAALAGDDRPDPAAIATARENINKGLEWLSKRGWRPAQQLSWLRKWGPKTETVSSIPVDRLADAVAALRKECEAVQAAAPPAQATANGKGARRG
jgi:hypothetical protein